jgi:hypothetical protein
MVQVAIGITVGLFFSSFIVYSIGTSKKGELWRVLFKKSAHLSCKGTAVFAF